MTQGAVLPRNTFYYLAYGSNLHPLRLQERCPTAAPLRAVRLPGYTLCFHKRGRDGSAKADLRPCRTGTAHGALFEIGRGDLPSLDRAEGKNRGYRRERLAPPADWGLPPGEQVTTYFAQEEYIDPALLPFRWYRDLVVAGMRYHGFPAELVRRVERQSAEEDMDPEREAGSRRLLKKLAR